jgi:hypothetical protein
LLPSSIFYLPSQPSSAKRFHLPSSIFHLNTSSAKRFPLPFMDPRTGSPNPAGTLPANRLADVDHGFKLVLDPSKFLFFA